MEAFDGVFGWSVSGERVFEASEGHGQDAAQRADFRDGERLAEVEERGDLGVGLCSEQCVAIDGDSKDSRGDEAAKLLDCCVLCAFQAVARSLKRR